MSDKEERDYDDHDREFMIFLEPLGRTFEHEYMRIGRAALLNHDSEYKTYAEVPDLHPEYEEKYALFIERFEEVFGKECNPMHLQTTWRHFWELMLTNLKEKDWKEKKKKFQDKFREKYRERHDRLLADREALRVKKEASRKRSEKRSMEEKKTKEEKKTSNEEIIFVKDVKVKRSSPESRKERETDSDRAKKSKTEPDPPTSSKPNPLAPRGSDLKQKKESPLQSSPKKVRGREELEKIYIETCSQISREAEKTSAPMLIDDTASSACEKHLKFPTKQADGSKPKIVFNLGVSKKAPTLEPEYSLKEALHFLKLVCSKIGMMGHALESIVDKASSLMPNEYKAYLVFSEDDSELLVNICITKIKALLSSSSEAEAKIYRNTISLTQRLLQEYKKAKLNPLLEDSSNVACRVDLMAIAKATTGMDTEATFKFIRNTFLYKGLSEPSKSELDHVFKEVSAIHFKMAFG